MRQVDRGHWNSQEKEYFYVKRAEALGVQSRGGDRKSEINVTNVTMAPSQEDHTDALGVQSRGGDRGNQYQSGNPKNFGMVPSAKEHEIAFPQC